MNKNMRKLKQIRDLISQGKTPEAFEILKKIVEDNPIIDDIIIRNAHFNNLERSIIRGTISQDEVIKQENQINQALLKITRVIENTYSPKKQKRKYLLGIVSLSIALAVCTLFLIKSYKKLTSPDIVLVGSGTVNNYLQDNVFKANTLNFPRIIRLESPSDVGIKILANVFQETDPESQEKTIKNLPHLIGMVSFEIDDTTKFTLDVHDPERRYYAIQIGKDNLVAIVGGKNNDKINKFINKSGPTKNNNEETIAIDDIQAIIDKVENKHLLITVDESGTFKNWNSALIDNGNKTLPVEKSYFYTDSQASVDYISTLDSCWICLGSDYYKVVPAEGCCSRSLKILNDSSDIIGRPLYLGLPQ